MLELPHQRMLGHLAIRETARAGLAWMLALRFHSHFRIRALFWGIAYGQAIQMRLPRGYWHLVLCSKLD